MDTTAPLLRPTTVQDMHNPLLVQELSHGSKGSCGNGPGRQVVLLDSLSERLDEYFSLPTLGKSN